MSLSIAVRSPALVWDIYCKLVDNYGDVGACWRLAVDLATRGHRVRLFLDDLAPLAWMAPKRHAGVDVIHWDRSAPRNLGNVVVAAFSCELDDATLEAIGARRRSEAACVWIHLEHLSAESFSARAHGRAAPVLRGPAAGAPRFAFYPGFTEATGGLLREPDLPQRQLAFKREAWLTAQGLPWRAQTLISMFCYEPPQLPGLLAQFAEGDQAVLLLVCAGRGARAVRQALGVAINGGEQVPIRHGRLTLAFLPPLTQIEYDHLLWACDLNFVRGEDSLVRALWAGRPWVWNIYPQDDGAHQAKLRALLNTMQASDSLRRFSEAWNGIDTGGQGLDNPLREMAQWQGAIQTWRDSLLGQPDLTSQLIEFATKAG